MPITAPEASTSGPPESPGWTSAFTWIIPVSCSEVPEDSSLAVIDWFRAVTLPGAAVGVRPVPPALPMAVTGSPTLTVDESPSWAVDSPEALASWRTARSALRS